MKTKQTINYLFELEKGNAEIRIELKGGFIRVYHHESGELLHKRLARKGDWSNLWAELSKPDRNNGVSVLGRVELPKMPWLSEVLFLAFLFTFWYILIQIFH